MQGYLTPTQRVCIIAMTTRKQMSVQQVAERREGIKNVSCGARARNYLSDLKGAQRHPIATDDRRALHETRTSSRENTERQGTTTNDERSEGALASVGPPATPATSSATATQVWWHVNKGGFPIPADTWERMWQHIVDVHPNGREVAMAIRGQSCKRVPIPKVPVLSPSTAAAEGLLAVQRYLQDLQYNHTGTQFFDIKKNRPLSRLMETAKDIVQTSLPIKCLEAVVVAVYLTAPLVNVQRLALSFKSQCSDMYYRHIVLAVYSGGKFGALGLSRRRGLMYKPLHYESLATLIQDFVQCYKNYHHKVVKVRLSSPIPHDLHSCEQISWKHLSLTASELHEKHTNRELVKFVRSLRTVSSSST